MEMYLSRKEYTLEHPIDADLLMGVFDGGALETRTMSRVGCLDYSARPRPRGRSRGRGSWSGMSATSSTGTCLIFRGKVVSTQLDLKFAAAAAGTRRRQRPLRRLLPGTYARHATRDR